MSTSILHRHFLEGTVTGLGPPLALLIVEYLLGFYPGVPPFSGCQSAFGKPSLRRHHGPRFVANADAACVRRVHSLSATTCSVIVPEPFLKNFLPESIENAYIVIIQSH